MSASGGTPSDDGDETPPTTFWAALRSASKSTPDTIRFASLLLIVATAALIALFLLTNAAREVMPDVRGESIRAVGGSVLLFGVLGACRVVWRAIRRHRQGRRTASFSRSRLMSLRARPVDPWLLNANDLRDGRFRSASHVIGYVRP